MQGKLKSICPKLSKSNKRVFLCISESLSLVAWLSVASKLAPWLRMTHLGLSLSLNLFLRGLSIANPCKVVIDSRVHIPLVVYRSKWSRACSILNWLDCRLTWRHLKAILGVWCFRESCLRHHTLRCGSLRDWVDWSGCIGRTTELIALTCKHFSVLNLF